MTTFAVTSFMDNSLKNPKKKEFFVFVKIIFFGPIVEVSIFSEKSLQFSSDNLVPNCIKEFHYGSISQKLASESFSISMGLSSQKTFYIILINCNRLRGQDNIIMSNNDLIFGDFQKMPYISPK